MTSPRTLSNKELLSRISRLRRQEHETTLEIVLHLNEIERRGLYLQLGYGSLFDYCTLHLKYSSSAAGRRILVARSIRKHPECLVLLKRQEATLSTISLIAKVLDDKNKTTLLEAIKNKSQKQVEAIACRYRPPVALRDHVRPVMVRVTRPDTGEPGGNNILSAADADATSLPADDASRCTSLISNPDSSPKSIPQTGSGMSDHSRSGSNCLSNIKSEQKLLIQFLADEAFMRNYEKVRSLLSHRVRENSFEAVFSILIHEFLERRSPERKKARRDAKKKQRADARVQELATDRGGRDIVPRTISNPGSGKIRKARINQTHSRYIPDAVRERVYARDGGRCAYTGTTGRRCGSTQALQIDHIVPFSRGGPATPGNLRLLCAKHNRLAARERLGENRAR